MWFLDKSCCYWKEPRLQNQRCPRLGKRGLLLLISVCKSCLVRFGKLLTNLIKVSVLFQMFSIVSYSLGTTCFFDCFLSFTFSFLNTLLSPMYAFWQPPPHSAPSTWAHSLQSMLERGYWRGWHRSAEEHMLASIWVRNGGGGWQQLEGILQLTVTRLPLF